MIGFVLSFALGTAVPASAQEPSTPAVPAIVTTGEAVVRRAPDRAFLVDPWRPARANPKDAQTQNAKAMTAGTAAPLATQGFPRRRPDARLQHPAGIRFHERPPRAARLRGAERRRSACGCARARRESARRRRPGRSDIDRRNPVRPADRAGAEREALRLAVADARARAEAAASGAGRTIDRVLRIDDTRREIPRPVPMAMMAREAAAGGCRDAGRGRSKSRSAPTVTSDRVDQ